MFSCWLLKFNCQHLKIKQFKKCTQTENKWLSVMLIWNTFYETGKTYPITGLDRPLQLPEYLDSTWRWEGCQLCAWTAFTPKEISLVLFLLKAESIPGSEWSQKDQVHEKSQWPPPGTNPATFWFVMQCFNQLRHHKPSAKNLNFTNFVWW